MSRRVAKVLRQRTSKSSDDRVDPTPESSTATVPWGGSPSALHGRFQGAVARCSASAPPEKDVTLVRVAGKRVPPQLATPYPLLQALGGNGSNSFLWKAKWLSSESNDCLAQLPLGRATAVCPFSSEESDPFPAPMARGDRCARLLDGRALAPVLQPSGRSASSPRPACHQEPRPQDP